jgi:hypothetical protein
MQLFFTGRQSFAAVVDEQRGKALKNMILGKGSQPLVLGLYTSQNAII